MADGYPFAYFKVAAQGFNATVYDTDDLSITRGSSLTLLAMPKMLKTHLEDEFGDLSFDWIQFSASELVFRCVPPAKAPEISIRKVRGKAPAGVRGSKWNNALQEKAKGLKDHLNDQVLRQAARGVAVKFGLEETGDDIAGRILAKCGNLPEGPPQLSTEQCQKIGNAISDFTSREQGGWPFDLMLFNVVWFRPERPNLKPMDAIGALDTRLGRAALHRLSCIVPAPAQIGKLSASEAVCRFTGILAAEGERVVDGYVTDIVNDMTLDWIRDRDADEPFMVMSHHKAPHAAWEPDEKHAQMYDDVTIREPETFWDDYATRSPAADAAKCRMVDLLTHGLTPEVPEGLSEGDEISWLYQQYVKNYLRCVASIDDNVGRLLDYLEESGLADNTMVVYTSDQGFFLGDHGWFDKRFMYEESLAMPLLISYPDGIAAGSVCPDFVLNVDFAPTFLELAGIEAPSSMQGTSFAPLLAGRSPGEWQKSMYYRYWMHRDDQHNIFAHYGVRTHDHKLIYFYNDPLDQPGAFGPIDPPSWELYDLRADPYEINNVYGNPAYAAVERDLKVELARLQLEVGDVAHPSQEVAR